MEMVLSPTTSAMMVPNPVLFLRIKEAQLGVLVIGKTSTLLVLDGTVAV